MWLLPIFGVVCRLICWVFYRLRVSGERPGAGPVVLVANHPNALLDPVLVVVAAARPVRFLAKAPLFDQTGIGWLVKGVGSIPVFRPADFPGENRSNDDMFEAAFEALAGGAAIGLFPEGTSHSDPEIKPLKTGAARIALGCLRSQKCRPRIVPVGLVLRAKQTFRSEAFAVLGQPISWDDMEDDDPETVRELTRRIDDGLRGVTVNLEAWEDGPLVETAEALYRVEVLEASARSSTESDRDSGPALEPEFEPDARGDTPEMPPSPAPGDSELDDENRRIERLAMAARILRDRRRRAAAPEDPALVSDLLEYEEELRALRLTPIDVAASQSLSRHLQWVSRRLYLFGPPSITVAVVGYWLFWPPYRLTGLLSERLAPSVDQLATYKVLAGSLCYGLWVLALSLAGAFGLSSLWPGAGGVGEGEGQVPGWWVQPFLFVLLLALIPLIGMAGLVVRERWRSSRGELGRFLRLRRRRELAARLRKTQVELARRIDAVVRQHIASVSSTGLQGSASPDDAPEASG